MSQPKIKVYVSVSGGCAEVFTDSPMLTDIVVVDWDNAKDSENGTDDAMTTEFEDGRNVQDMLDKGELF